MKLAKERSDIWWILNLKMPGNRAFSRLDLMVMVGIVAFFGAWFSYTHTGERERIAKCTRNLQILGQAIQNFADDHGSALPPAGIEQPTITCDMEVLPYLHPDTLNTNS